MQDIWENGTTCIIVTHDLRKLKALQRESLARRVPGHVEEVAVKKRCTAALVFCLLLTLAVVLLMGTSQAQGCI